MVAGDFLALSGLLLARVGCTSVRRDMVGPHSHKRPPSTEQIAALVGALDTFDHMRKRVLCELSRLASLRAQIPKAGGKAMRNASDVVFVKQLGVGRRRDRAARRSRKHET